MTPSAPVIEPPDSHTPVALYEGPQVTTFRGWKLLALVAVCVAAGAGARELMVRTRERAQQQLIVEVTAPPPVSSSAATRRLSTWPIVLPTPEGHTLRIDKPALVHVWLQGCPDCMPAFEAMKGVTDTHVFEAFDEINVAYGSADPAWAQRYGVARNLAFDSGTALVQPLGIGTFTTLVVDGTGGVDVIGSPTQTGYTERVRTRMNEVLARAYSNAKDARKGALIAFLRGRRDVLRTCAAGPSIEFVSFTIEPTGGVSRVSNALSDGRSDDRAVACMRAAVVGADLGVVGDGTEVVIARVAFSAPAASLPAIRAPQ